MNFFSLFSHVFIITHQKITSRFILYLFAFITNKFALILHSLLSKIKEKRNMGANVCMFTLQVKKYRILRRYTQKQLAQKAGLTQGYVTALEKTNRTKSPTLKTIEKLANALEVHPFDLLEYQNSYKNK